MRALSFIVSVLLAGSAYAQAPASVYTPTQRDLGVPTFINATVLRVDARHNTVTFRSESREVTLTAEGEAIASLGRLRPGDQVILGYRMDDRSGRPVQIVTAILAGEEMARRGFVAAANSPVATATGGDFSTVTGRVVRVDRGAGTFTLVDAEGRTETIGTQGSVVSSLTTMLPGDQVEVSFIPGSPTLLAGAVGVGGVLGTANSIQLAASPTFVTGAVQGFDAQTGALTLRTPFGEQIFTLPPSTNVSLGQLTVGQNVRLNLTGTGRSFAGVTPLTATGTTGSTSRIASGSTVTGSRATTTTMAGVRGTFAQPLTTSSTGVATGNRSAALRGTTGTISTMTAGTITPTTGSASRGGSVTTFSNSSLPAATATGRTTGAPTVSGVNGGFGNAGLTSGGVAGGTVPTTTSTLAGVQPQRASGVLTTGNTTISTPSTGLPTGGALATGNPNAVGLPGGINTNTAGGAATAGVNTGTVSSPGAVNAGVGNFGTVSAGISPLATVIPSLPSVVGQLNVVPPPAAAPALPETLPVGAARDVATHDYDSGVHAMALKANEIDAHWFRYRDSCLRDNSTSIAIEGNLYGGNRDREWFVLFDEDVRTPADDNCRQLRVELNRMADEWRGTMTRLEDSARKNDVLPGAMREVRQRYRVEF